MADPLSIAASTTGITTAALQSVQFLSATIDNIKDLPETLKRIRADLQAVEIVLHKLERANRGEILAGRIRSAVENCDMACVSFQSQLDCWTKRSIGDKMFWVDRWRVGLFGQDRIKTLRGQLNDSKATLNVALSTANMYVMSLQLIIRCLFR